MLDDLKTKWFCGQVRALKNSMYALAIGILKNDADAEDAIQNTLLAAYEHLDELRFFEKFKPWILKILTRECYRVAGGRHSHADVDEIALAAPPAPDPDTKESVWSAVCQLESVYRDVVILFYYENLTTRQIAQILNISEDNVRKRLSRAREALRSRLNREDFT